jgi:D-alanyl-D-alanine carboxypeptidase/D-alanyl-D-alanine-endopeptidase (penicillin-binding protein 4)
MRFWVMFCAAAASCGAAGSQQMSVSAKVKELLSAQRYAPADAGILVRDLTADSTIVSVNADSLLNPASVSKLVTGAAALERLGAAYSFTTSLFAGGPFSRDSGVLAGDLYVKGTGDPGMVVERLWLLVQHMLQAGIRTIRGNLVLDDFYFDSLAAGPGFGEDGSSRAYDAPVGALSASFNSVAVVVRPGDTVGSPVGVSLFPKIKNVRIECSATTAGANGKTTVDAATDDRNGTVVIRVTGTMRLGDRPRELYRKAFRPRENFGDAFMALLSENGIRLTGSARHGRTPDSLMRDTLVAFPSQPLLEFVRAMFKWSSNFSAEMIFKALAAADSQTGTWDNGSRTMAAWWKSAGLPGAPAIKNGSGMGANTNRYSPVQLVALLAHVWNRRDYLPDYLSALSISGVDGTLQSRFSNSPLKGIVRGKTGTLNDIGVSTLAGYVLLPDRTLAFAVLLRNPKAAQTTQWMVQEKVLEMAAGVR